MHWFDNESPARSKIKNSSQRTLFLSLINDNRMVNISIVKFPKLKQLFVYSVETLPRKSSLVIKKFNQLDSDKKYRKDRETSNFAYFSEKGYLSKVNIFVRPPVGAIQYVDLTIFDLH